MTEDVEWITPPTDPEPGHYRATPGCEGVWDQWRVAVGQLRFEPEEFVDSGDNVVVVAKRSGRGEQSGLEVLRSYGSGLELRGRQVRCGSSRVATTAARRSTPFAPRRSAPNRDPDRRLPRVRAAGRRDAPGRARRAQDRRLQLRRASCYAIEDRCSHDDGPLAEGEFDAGACTVECPRHGSLFDLTTGRPKTLPAYRPVRDVPGQTHRGRRTDRLLEVRLRPWQRPRQSPSS